MESWKDGSGKLLMGYVVHGRMNKFKKSGKG